MSKQARMKVLSYVLLWCTLMGLYILYKRAMRASVQELSSGFTRFNSALDHDRTNYYTPPPVTDEEQDRRDSDFKRFMRRLF